MTDDQWKALAMLLDKGFKWREPFVGAVEDTYQVLLDGYEPAQIASAITALVASGQVFGPTPGEIVAQIREDPDIPVWSEAYDKIYGRRGILRARPPYPSGGWTGDQLQVAQDKLGLELADEYHPLFGAFVRTQTLRRLRMLHVDDPNHGELVRKELGEDWALFIATTDRRQVAAIAAGGQRRGLRRVDPSTVINGHTTSGRVPELEPGR